MKTAILTLSFCGIVASYALAQQKSFTEKLDGIKTSGKELTKNSGTDNSSIGQGGEMNTSVPLVTVTSRTMSFPLQLQYAAGITVDQQSGPVGLGWALPLGSIVRDYGAFEPDYTTNTNEVRMKTAASGGLDGWISPETGDLVNPFDNGQYLGYDAVDATSMNTTMSDKYHVSVPGFLSNTFWNGANLSATSPEWRLTEYERWKVAGTPKTFTIAQEFSRINELNIENCTGCTTNKNKFGTEGSFAAAIGLLPYVKNGHVYTPSGNSGGWTATDNEKIVKYEDFGTFTIVDENGTVYVFGRPLRGQKFMFSDDPYWSTRTASDPYSPTPSSNIGNFWKIDFIAEWLLTEIHSVDYADLNENGIADDGDAGDWIRFEYTSPTKSEYTTRVFGGGGNLPMQQQVPSYREWSNFSQTDQASSLMREVAYLQRIVTPTQQIDLTISPRMEVDHDYYSKPANKVGNDFYYADRKYSSSGTGGDVKDFDVFFPIETMKYDTIKVHSRLINKSVYAAENTLTGKIVLNYAAKGSSQELAVSNYLIRDNTNTDKLIDQPDDAFSIDDYYSSSVKRGKTTLLSIDFFGADENPSDKSSYAFEYGYNPSYDEIHKRAIVNKFFFPSLRQSYHSGVFPDIRQESPMSYAEKVTGSNGTSYTTTTHSSISPYDFLIDFPYHERHYKISGDDDETIDATSGGLSFTSTEIAHPLKPVMDVYGYYYVDGYAMSAQAWSLTKITYPTGGQISFEYERGDYAVSTDDASWSFGANEIPLIKEYNAVARKRSYYQDDFNRAADNQGFYSGWTKQKTLTATFEVDLPEYIGIRLKSKTVDDRLNPTVVTTYTYGTGHMTALPSSYVSNCLGGFNQFIMRERLRHDWEKNYYPLQFPSGWSFDYDERMRQLAISNTVLDGYSSVHFYETTDAVAADGSKIRTHYGPITGSLSGVYADYSIFCSRLAAASSWGARFVIGGNVNSAIPVALKKTEMFENGQGTAYHSTTYTYTRSELFNKKVKFKYNIGLTEYEGYPEQTTPPANKTVLFDNVFDVYVPIWCPDGLNSPTCVSPEDYTSPNDLVLSTDPVGLASNWSTNASNGNPKAFIYANDYDFSDDLELPNANYTAMEYEKWGSYATRQTKVETNYKGMISSVEYTFHSTQHYLQQEKKESTHANEDYITVYEYAHETYNGITPKFSDLNVLSWRSKTTTYLNSVAAANALSAEVITYDHSFDVPKPLDTYKCEMAVNHTTGTFTLPTFSTSSADWRVVEADNYLYNRTAIPVSSRKNQIYTKTVTGNGLNTVKATISSVTPGVPFDATYTGFEDLSDRKMVSEWTDQSYLDEDWLAHENSTATVSAKAYTSGSYLVCPNSSTFMAGAVTSYHVVTVNSITNLAVGDEVTVSFDYSGSTTQFQTEVSSLMPKTVLHSSLQANAYNYVVCFTDAVPFPAVDPTPSVTNTVVNKATPVYRISSSYARTGEYSYKLPTIRSEGETAKKTPIRPVHFAASEAPSGCDGERPLRSCFWNYQASLWIKYDKDIPPSTPTSETVPTQSDDADADAIYRRGTIGATNQNVRIVCQVWNADRTSLLSQEYFYPQNVNTAWQQFTVDLSILKGAEKWLDVYVENQINQQGVTILNLKSVFVDDIVIRPNDAKYNYTIYDKFGNQTFVVDNNDVYTEKTFDAKGRARTDRNAYGKTVHETTYYDHPNWTTGHNHITERNWVTNSLYNDVRFYLDGFGKTKQVIASDNVKNLRTVIETNVFNNKGQVYRSYKPYSMSGATLSNKYDGVFTTRTQTLYASNYAYTEVDFEATPEERIAAVHLPRTNSESDIVSTQSDFVNSSTVTHPYWSAYPTFTAGTLIVHEMIDQLGKKTRTYIDNLGRVILEEHEIGYLNGGGTTHTQNADGSITVPTSGTMQYARTWFVYDGASRLIETYDPDGKKTEYFYNSLGLTVKSISPDKGMSEMRYDKYDQIRFTKTANDYAAILANDYGCDQFTYTKYDKWGREIESGVLTVAPNSLGGSTSSPPFPTAEFFDDYTSINNQDFPASSQKFVQIHETATYDGSRTQYSSTSMLTKTSYSGHTLNTSTYLYAAGKTDVVAHTYKADGQPAKTTYTYDGLAGTHQIAYLYNDMRLPVGKDYTNSVNNAYNFKWRTTPDNFGRTSVSSNIHNITTTQTAKNYYDGLGNLMTVGVGTTGNPSDPHLDYQSIKKDIRDQLTIMMSKFYRTGLTYDAGGNITNQYWNTPYFDPTSPSANIHQYNYVYDKMHRLIGADYKQSTASGNPFSVFATQTVNFPNDFNCSVNESEVELFMGPIFAEFEDNIANNINKEQSQTAIDALNKLKELYLSNNILYGTMSQTKQEAFLQDYLDTCSLYGIDVEQYEYYRATEESDTDHIDSLDNKSPDPALMKYTVQLLQAIPFITDVDCYPNNASTVYGYLPAFPMPTASSNATKYDAAYWYTANGNMTKLHRNDDAGVKTVQDYAYASSLNNKLTGVTWTVGAGTPFSHSYGYDANGNLLADSRNSVTAIGYSAYHDLPTAITKTAGTSAYRYMSGERTVKEISDSDREYYIDGIVLSQNGAVKSYQVDHGYATPASGSVTYFYEMKDWLGTTRATLDASGTTLNASDYYPYGKKLPGRNTFTSSYEGYRYQFTGHEMDGETGYQYHGARYYSEELGRYMSVDPKANKFMSWSTYNYVLGNPVRFIDPDGKSPTDWFVNKKTGTVIFLKGESTVTQEKLDALGSTYDPTDYVRIGEDNMFGDKPNWRGNDIFKNDVYALQDKSESFMLAQGYLLAEKLSVRESENKQWGSFGPGENVTHAQYRIDITSEGMRYVKEGAIDYRFYQKSTTERFNSASIWRITYEYYREPGESGVSNTVFLDNSTEKSGPTPADVINTTRTVKEMVPKGQYEPKIVKDFLKHFPR